MVLVFSSSLSQSLDSKPETGKNNIRVIAKSYGDSIVIRWAPSQPFIWQLGNQYGYKITRLTIGNAKGLQLEDPVKKILTPKPLKPAPLSQWEPLAMENTNAALAAQAIYGKSMEFTNKADQMGGLVNKARLMENKFSLALFAADQSAKVAQLHGLRFADNNVKPGFKYLYRVKLVEGASVDSGYVYQALNDTFSIPKPRGLEANFGDKVVELRWNKRDFRHIFSSYQLEKSTDGGVHFKVVNKLPFINPGKGPENAPKYMYYTDSLQINDQEYIYRIRGKTPFGELSPPSDTVSGKGKLPPISVNPYISEKQILKNDRIKIEWKINNPDGLDFQSFQILRSNRASGGFSVINSQDISPGVHSFTDESPLTTNYYRVRVIGAGNRHSTSFPVLVQLPDSIPPKQPEGLTGRIDTTGVVFLDWQPNTEQDLAGYRVLRANTPDAEFMQITKNLISQPFFRDTITVKTLSKQIYYKIVAMDNRFNRSEMTSALELNRPDLVPPSSPAFKNLQNKDSSIVLSWHPSNSEDVVSQLLYRKRPFQSSWNLIAELNNDKKKYIDAKVTRKTSYNYRIIAVDESGLESKNGQKVTAKTIDRGFRQPVENFYSKVDRSAHQVELAWTYSNANVERFVIYRRQVGESLRILGAIPGNKEQFTDRQLTINSQYGYRIQAVFADGGKSPISDVLKVKY